MTDHTDPQAKAAESAAQRLHGDVSPDNPPTHLTIMVRAAGGLVQGVITLEVDDRVDTGELWQYQYEPESGQRVYPDEPLPTVNSDAAVISDDMAGDYFESLLELFAAAGIQAGTEWLDSGDVQVFAYVHPENGVMLEHTYDSEGFTLLEDLVGADDWRWHRGDF